MTLGFDVRAPAWLDAETAALPDELTPSDAVAVAVELAARNVAEGSGGPFAAVVTESGTGAVVAAGVNLVLASGLSSMHAEVVALSLAQTARGGWDLGAGAPLRIAVNAAPCAMCTGAVVWSGVSALDYALESAEVERITGFDEGPIAADWAEQLEARGIRVAGGFAADAARAGLIDFAARVARGESVVYNAVRG